MQFVLLFFGKAVIKNPADGRRVYQNRTLCDVLIIHITLIQGKSWMRLGVGTAPKGGPEISHSNIWNSRIRYLRKRYCHYQQSRFRYSLPEWNCTFGYRNIFRNRTPLVINTVGEYFLTLLIFTPANLLTTTWQLV